MLMLRCGGGDSSIYRNLLPSTSKYWRYQSTLLTASYLSYIYSYVTQGERKERDRFALPSFHLTLARYLTKNPPKNKDDRRNRNTFVTYLVQSKTLQIPNRWGNPKTPRKIPRPTFFSLFLLHSFGIVLPIFPFPPLRRKLGKVGRAKTVTRAVLCTITVNPTPDFHKSPAYDRPLNSMNYTNVDHDWGGGARREGSGWRTCIAHMAKQKQKQSKATSICTTTYLTYLPYFHN